MERPKVFPRKGLFRKMLTNCDIWSIVDFGNGPVEIRCTEVGEHSDHRCEIRIEVDEDPQISETSLDRRNIFKDDRKVS